MIRPCVFAIVQTGLVAELHRGQGLFARPRNFDEALYAAADGLHTRVCFFLSVGFARPAVAQPQSANEGAEFYETKVRPIWRRTATPATAGWRARKSKADLIFRRARLDQRGRKRRSHLARKSIGKRSAQSHQLSRIGNASEGKAAATADRCHNRLGQAGRSLVRQACRGASPRKSAGGRSRRSFWSFQPVHRPEVPAVHDPMWVRDPIDAFIAAGLDAVSLKLGAATRRHRCCGASIST